MSFGALDSSCPRSYVRLLDGLAYALFLVMFGRADTVSFSHRLQSSPSRLRKPPVRWLFRSFMLSMYSYLSASQTSKINSDQALDHLQYH